MIGSFRQVNLIRLVPKATPFGLDSLILW